MPPPTDWRVDLERLDPEMYIDPHPTAGNYCFCREGCVENRETGRFYKMVEIMGWGLPKEGDGSEDSMTPSENENIQQQYQERSVASSEEESMGDEEIDDDYERNSEGEGFFEERNGMYSNPHRRYTYMRSHEPEQQAEPETVPEADLRMRIEAERQHRVSQFNAMKRVIAVLAESERKRARNTQH